MTFNPLKAINQPTFNSSKRTYHPLIILLYHSKMLNLEQVQEIPYTTRKNWDSFAHSAYFGHEMAADYIQHFDQINTIYSRKYLRKSLKMMLFLSNGYRTILSEMDQNKKLLRQNAHRITLAITRMQAYSGQKISDIARLFGVSRDWFYRYRTKKNCRKSKLNKCFQDYPTQLTLADVSLIDTLVSNPENQRKPLTTLYYSVLRLGKLNCCYATFNKYAKLCGHKGRLKKHPTKRKKGLRATRVFEWLHIDVTFVQTIMDGIQKVVFVKDNYSKALLHYGSTDETASSDFIKKIVAETFLKYNLLEQIYPINILSDGGSENKGQLLEWIYGQKAPPIISKIIAGTPDFPFSNSMSERTHSIYKSEFMGGQFSLDKSQHLADLDRFFNYYNTARFPVELYGYSPMEVVAGNKPDKNRFQIQLQEARKKRIEINRQFNDCPFLIGCGTTIQ